MGAFIDLKNKTFGRLIALYVESNVDGLISWMCECNCESKNRVVVLGASLRGGKTKSCGCLAIETSTQLNKTHGLSKTPIHNTWCSMKTRCNDINDKNYGGRGITYDPRWESFEEFYKDMGDTWFETGTIDRIDVNGNYELDNCRWVIMKVQANNKRNNVYVTIRGEILTLGQVSEKYGIYYHTIVGRYNKNKRDEELISPIEDKAELQSNVIGVTWDKSKVKWSARIQINDKMEKLGTFIDIEDAIKARLQAEIVNFGLEFAPQKHLFEFYTVEDCTYFKKEEKYIGVTSNNDNWTARITYNGQKHYLGHYKEFKDALILRLNAELKFYGRELAPQRHLFELYNIK